VICKDLQQCLLYFASALTSAVVSIFSVSSRSQSGSIINFTTFYFLVFVNTVLLCSKCVVESYGRKGLQILNRLKYCCSRCDYCDSIGNDSFSNGKVSVLLN